MQSTTQYSEFQAHSYPSVASQLSGDLQDTDAWQKGQKQRQHLTEQTHNICKQLEDHGIEAYQDQDLTIFGLHSKSFKKVDPFRNICFLPSVAQKNRAKTLKTLEFFLQKYPNARTCVLTSGTRCGLEELPSRVRWMHRKVSRCNSMKWMKEAGARFIFRSTELGEIAPVGRDISCHPHTHLVFILDKYLTREKWSQLLSNMHAFFGTHFEDCGKLKNPRELVKYCVKPGDFQYLESFHVANLYHATKGIRLVESLKDLRLLKRDLKERRKKLVRRKGVIKVVPNWVGGSSHEEIPRHEITERNLAVGSCGASLDAPMPTLVAWCAPARVFTPVTEPIFIVHGLGKANYRTDQVFEWEEVKRMEHSISVHTKTLTVLDQIGKSIPEGKKRYEDQKKIPDNPIHT
jgi:hypothetical protein